MIRMLFGTKPRLRRIASNCSRNSGECSAGRGAMRAGDLTCWSMGLLHLRLCYNHVRLTAAQGNVSMIDLYYWTTPNGHKITIFLEETGLPYKIFPINIGKGEQFANDFLKFSPNNRIPAMIDRDPQGGGAPIAVFESGAMLLYLADKTKKFIAQDLRGRTETIEWLF